MKYRGRLVIGCALAAFVFFASPFVVAQMAMQANGTVIELPPKGSKIKVSRKNNLTVSVDTRWANNYGMRPIQLRFESPTAPAGDRSIRVQLHGGWWSREQGVMSVEEEFTFPAGQTSLDGVILYPQYRVAVPFYWWDVWIDGIKDDDLSLDHNDAAQIYQGISQPSVDTLSMLVIGPKSQARQMYGSPTLEYQVVSLTEREFPGDWREYSSFDVVALDLGGLREIERVNPEAIAALKLWCRAGGQVWVGMVGDEWEELGSLSKTFDLQGPLPGSESTTATKEEIDLGEEEQRLGWQPREFRRGRGDGGEMVAFVNLVTNERIVSQDPYEIAELRRNPDLVEVGYSPETQAEQAQAKPDPGAEPAVDPAQTGEGVEPEPEVPLEGDPAGAAGGGPPQGGTPPPDTEEPDASVLGDVAVVDDPTDAPPNEPAVAGFVEVEPDGTGNFGNPERRRRLPRDSSQWFVDHDLGLGYLRAFRGPWEGLPLEKALAPPVDNESPDPLDRMPLGMRMALMTSDNWVERHGLEPNEPNPAFANLLVPGLGLAPVTEFQILITLFVVLIGPVNYWILKRMGRLHLLVLTVPLAAALLTISLFVYATVSDGFGTTVRVRSYTSIDQRTGESSCWAWLSYYSGLAPSAGLSFPTDVALYPIEPAWRDARYDPDLAASREAVWRPDRLLLTRGWLQSRTPTQYLSIRARRTPLHIEFAQTGDRLRATNRLGTPIAFLIAVDGRGNLLAGEKIASEERLFLTPTTRAEAIRNLRQRIIANQPQVPDELAGGVSDFSLLGGSSRRSRGRYGYGDETLSEGLLETRIGDLGGMNGLAPLRLGPNSYVAITDRGPEVELGMDGAQEESSFHVVVGAW